MTQSTMDLPNEEFVHPDVCTSVPQEDAQQVIDYLNSLPTETPAPQQEETTEEE